MDSDPGSQSVTLWLKELEQGNNEAALELWNRYFKRLVSLARSKLYNVPKRISDEEDIAINVFYSLCDGIEKGRFDRLDDRDDLWKLLVVMTHHKSANQIRHQTAKKRGGGKVRGHSIADEFQLDEMFVDDPTPEFFAEVQEEQERLFAVLANDSLRNVAHWRMQGYSVEETAEKLGISSRSVKRKLALIRESWLVEFGNESEEPED